LLNNLKSTNLTLNKSNSDSANPKLLENKIAFLYDKFEFFNRTFDELQEHMDTVRKLVKLKDKINVLASNKNHVNYKLDYFEHELQQVKSDTEMKISQVDNKMTVTSTKLGCDLTTTLREKLIEILKIELTSLDSDDLNDTNLSEV